MSRLSCAKPIEGGGQNALWQQSRLPSSLARNGMSGQVGHLCGTPSVSLALGVIVPPLAEADQHQATGQSSSRSAPSPSLTVSFDSTQIARAERREELPNKRTSTRSTRIRACGCRCNSGVTSGPASRQVGDSFDFFLHFLLGSSKPLMRGQCFASACWHSPGMPYIGRLELDWVVSWAAC